MSDYILLISVVLAGGITAWFIKQHQKWLPVLISFSGAYLFAIIVFHLLPDIFSVSGENEAQIKKFGSFLLGGLLFQLLLENLSHGIEHAHEHQHMEKHLSIGLLLGLFLHAFSEGLPVHQLHSHAYLYGILVHKFPIALVLVSFLTASGAKIKEVFLILLLFSLMTPLGTWVGEKSDILLKNHVYVSAFVAGLLTHISTTIIFESDKNHRIPIQKLLAIIVAFILAYLH